MKKRKLLTTLASVLLFACVFVGCKKVEKIDVLKKDMPQANSNTLANGVRSFLFFILY